MPQISVNGLAFEYESFGSASRPAVVLIMGLGAQLVRWPLPFCNKLVERGFRVIRFDNRDIGLSAKMDGAPVPELATIVAARMAGLPVRVPYTLDDMAADTVGLMDALQIEKAHIVGASMGGMIAQLVAADHASHVLSLTSIMSTTGNPALPPPTPAASAVLMARAPNPSDLDAYLQHSLNTLRVIGSPGAPFDEAAARERLTTEVKRNYNPAGFGRQLAAVTANGDRREKLRRIRTPTMVIHGTDDPLVPAAGGRDTAENIPGAELRIIPGMGHDLPPQYQDQIVDAIVAIAKRADPNVTG
ncbi:MAG TPA: alpha/beta hydrolase [Povalibacter sp.]|uniref:alpha/beta fold hydrolase n=1 Tax=Povalibacter sp. TaxID=1962978 RepID=UPI002BF3134E|nr:alpha/beta hydrolase [Povalibacter sp.]HMN45085.1 alpha/beta hydrolase [Povalibacter sp.]